MLAAAGGQEACVQTLLRAKADTELLDKDGHTPSCSAHCRAHTATAEFIRQHAACLSLVRGGVAREAERVAAASKARGAAKEAAATAAAAAEAAAVAEAEADALEQATAGGGGGSSSGAAGPALASEALEVPDDYICPITAEIMTDPVSTADGFTYERTAISEWLRTNDTSPSTGATLESKTLVPNLSLRSIIRSFVEA